ncbi:DUF3306 domain-containing protein, partial [Crenalkalicoccus roseus]|uniref:DUF3306 domain-containing protein n=1 Tax=Crenalkalicoccus roseus TaxID=1485588 RepID=UPI001080FA75
MSRDEEGFLARWSRRKRQAAAGAAEPEEPPPAAPPAPAPAEARPEEEEAFDLASLPPVESLTAASDITPFLRARVPALLRQAALRRLWSLDPAIRDFVGPADYAWDYNAPAGAPGFALDLGGEVRRLLAEATAPARTAAREAEAAPPEAPPEPPAVLPPAEGAAPEAPTEGAAEA